MVAALASVVLILSVLASVAVVEWVDHLVASCRFMASSLESASASAALADSDSDSDFGFDSGFADSE